MESKIVEFDGELVRLNRSEDEDVVAESVSGPYVESRSVDGESPNCYGFKIPVGGDFEVIPMASDCHYNYFAVWNTDEDVSEYDDKGSGELTHEIDGYDPERHDGHAKLRTLEIVDE